MALLVFLTLAGIALAADGYEVSWHAISAGGHAQGGPFALDGGVVQTAGVASGGGLEGQGGFWYGARPTLSGDMDGDCDVDIVDIMLVASRWNSTVGDARYDPRYDLDHDGDIDIVDIMLVATRWNQHC
jgi:hypothetical protein